MHELRRQAGGHRSADVEVHEPDVDATCELFPLLSPKELVGGHALPAGRSGDRHRHHDVAGPRGTHAWWRAVFERTRVTEVLRQGGRATGVRVTHPDGSSSTIEAEHVVNCTGMWGRQFGALADVRVPLQALHHFYVVTELVHGLPSDMPTIKSSDDWSYVKDDAGSLMVGFFEPGSTPGRRPGSRRMPSSSPSREDWEHLGPFYEQMTDRIPSLTEMGIRLFFSGPESFTPDGFYHLGPVAALDNYWLAAGFNSIGFLSGPGAGPRLADWIIDGLPSIDLPEVDPRRTHAPRDEPPVPRAAGRRDPRPRLRDALADRPAAQCRALRRSISARPGRRGGGGASARLLGWERAELVRLARDDPRVAADLRPPGVAHPLRRGARGRALEASGCFDLSRTARSWWPVRTRRPCSSTCPPTTSTSSRGGSSTPPGSTGRGGIEADVTVSRRSDEPHPGADGAARRRTATWTASGRAILARGA